MHEKFGQITEALGLLEQFASESTTASFEDSLNQTRLTSIRDARDVDFGLIQEFVAMENRIEIELSRGEWEARIVSTSPNTFDISAQGPREDAFADAPSIEAAELAVETNDIQSLLQLANDIPARLRLVLLNDPLVTGYHWIRKIDAIHNLIERDSWLGLITQIGDSNRPTRLVIQDGGESFVQTRGLVVHGPVTFPQLPSWSASEEAESYRQTWLRDSRREVLPPTWTIPVINEGLSDIHDVLTRVTGMLCWWWLAAEIRPETMPIRARFEGMRPVEVDLELDGPPDVREAIALWEWAVSTTDPARREAVQQAVSLSIRDERDLEQGFRPVFRTARYLLRISQQGLIAEALATRRTAREAAFSVARDSGEAARSALRKTFDRLVIQLGAGAGVLLANQQALINGGATRLLLGAIFILVVLTALGAFVIDYPSIRTALNAFDTDLEHYRDALPDEDLADIRNMESLRDARAQVRRTQIAAAVLLGAAAIAVLASLPTVTRSGESEPLRNPSPPVLSP